MIITFSNLLWFFRHLISFKNVRQIVHDAPLHLLWYVSCCKFINFLIKPVHVSNKNTKISDNKIQNAKKKKKMWRITEAIGATQYPKTNYHSFINLTLWFHIIFFIRNEKAFISENGRQKFLNLCLLGIIFLFVFLWCQSSGLFIILIVYPL